MSSHVALELYPSRVQCTIRSMSTRDFQPPTSKHRVEPPIFEPPISKHRVEPLTSKHRLEVMARDKLFWRTQETMLALKDIHYFY